MEVISLILAVPPLAELLVRLIPKTVSLVKTYRHASESVAETVTMFQDNTQKLQLELEEFRQLSPSLPTDIKEHIGHLFITLRGKLSAFEMEVDEFLRSRHVGVKVVLSSVTKIIEEVQSWQKRVEDYFELLNRWPKPFKDPRAANSGTALGRVRLVNEAIFAATESTPEALDLTETPLPPGLVVLPHSGVMMSAGATATGPATQSGLAIVEVKSVALDLSNEGVESMRRDVLDLARILSAEDVSTRGILKCRGYRFLDKTLDGKPGRQFLLQFEVPPELRHPRTLRSILVDKDFKGQVFHPLNERLNLAKQLARAVLHVHSKKHVHKNIRPDTILLFESVPTRLPAGSGAPTLGNEKAFPASLGTAFLVGFQRVRKDEADTTPIEPSDWSENIYRHPSKQGIGYAEEKFSMLHDIYSLGVCLLEIAIWRSFVEWDDKGNKFNSTKACNLMEPAVTGMERRFLTPKKVQEKLIRDARKRVPIALGQRYSQVVVRCLQCAETFASETEHDPFVGLKYIDQILLELEEIVL